VTGLRRVVEEVDPLTVLVHLAFLPGLDLRRVRDRRFRSRDDRDEYGRQAQQHDQLLPHDRSSDAPAASDRPLWERQRWTGFSPGGGPWTSGACTLGGMLSTLPDQQRTSSP